MCGLFEVHELISSDTIKGSGLIQGRELIGVRELFKEIR